MRKYDDVMARYKEYSEQFEDQLVNVPREKYKTFVDNCTPIPYQANREIDKINRGDAATEKKLADQFYNKELTSIICTLAKSKGSIHTQKAQALLAQCKMLQCLYPLDRRVSEYLTDDLGFTRWLKANFASGEDSEAPEALEVLEARSDYETMLSRLKSCNPLSGNFESGNYDCMSVLIGKLKAAKTILRGIVDQKIIDACSPKISRHSENRSAPANDKWEAGGGSGATSKKKNKKKKKRRKKKKKSSGGDASSPAVPVSSAKKAGGGQDGVRKPPKAPTPKKSSGGEASVTPSPAVPVSSAKKAGGGQDGVRKPPKAPTPKKSSGGEASVTSSPAVPVSSAKKAGGGQVGVRKPPKAPTPKKSSGGEASVTSSPAVPVSSAKKAGGGQVGVRKPPKAPTPKKSSGGRHHTARPLPSVTPPRGLLSTFFTSARNPSPVQAAACRKAKMLMFANNDCIGLRNSIERMRLCNGNLLRESRAHLSKLTGESHPVQQQQQLKTCEAAIIHVQQRIERLYASYKLLSRQACQAACYKRQDKSETSSPEQIAQEQSSELHKHLIDERKDLKKIFTGLNSCNQELLKMQTALRDGPRFQGPEVRTPVVTLAQRSVLNRCQCTIDKFISQIRGICRTDELNKKHSFYIIYQTLETCRIQLGGIKLKCVRNGLAPIAAATTRCNEKTPVEDNSLEIDKLIDEITKLLRVIASYSSEGFSAAISQLEVTFNDLEVTRTRIFEVKKHMNVRAR